MPNSEDKHKVLLTLDISMYKRIKADAEREERSVAGQIRYMLKHAEVILPRENVV